MGEEGEPAQIVEPAVAVRRGRHRAQGGFARRSSDLAGGEQLLSGERVRLGSPPVRCRGVPEHAEEVGQQPAGPRPIRAPFPPPTTGRGFVCIEVA